MLTEGSKSVSFFIVSTFESVIALSTEASVDACISPKVTLPTLVPDTEWKGTKSASTGTSVSGCVI